MSIADPHTLDRGTSQRLRDRLQEIREEAGAFLLPEHPAMVALLTAAEELSVAAFPKINRYPQG